MTSAALLSTLQAAGAVLTLDAGALHYKAPSLDSHEPESAEIPRESSA